MRNRINLSDSSPLQRIIRQNLYLDKQSEEKTTNTKKPKLKLAGNCILDHYFFHVLTRSRDACKRTCTLPLNKSDWENVVPWYKLADTSYCDLTKFDRIERDILLHKMRDKNNGFPYVAHLNKIKYKEFLSLRKNLHKHPRVSDDIKKTILDGISPSIEDLLSKLGLQ